MTTDDNNRYTVVDNSIKNCTITGCSCTINIGSINMKFGDININIGSTSSRAKDNRREYTSNKNYINEELDARMRFFKANSP